jgi:hypothetical protein
MDGETVPSPSMSTTKNNKVSPTRHNIKIHHLLPKRWRSIPKGHGDARKKTKGK